MHQEAEVGSLVHGVRHAGALAPDHERIVRREGRIDIAHGRPGRQQDETPGPGTRGARRLERVPRAVAREVEPIEIIHGGTAEFGIAHDEAARLDQIDAQPQAGRETHHRTGVLGDVGFEKS
jgi:hypothetical protein